MGLHKSQIPTINLRTTCRIGLQGEKKNTPPKKTEKKKSLRKIVVSRQT